MASLVCANNPCPYIHDPQHMQRFQHNGPQVVPTVAAAAPLNQGKAYYVPENKTKCPYGNSCQLMVRGDEYHFFAYTHNHEPEVVATTAAKPVNNTTAAPTPHVPKVCPQLEHHGRCAIADPEHLTAYSHPLGNGRHMPPSPVAQGGPAYHPNQQQHVVPRCSNYVGCSRTRGLPDSETHCEQFKHKCDHGNQCKFLSNPVHVRRFDHF